MMIETIILIIFGFLLGASFRRLIDHRDDVLLLRESLFSIRDDLWDKAKELNCFQDAAYTQARAHLNSAIAAADTISIPVVVYHLVHGAQAVELEKSPNWQMQTEIDKAFESAAATIFTHLFKYTTFGRCLLLLARGLKIVEWIKRKINDWTRSDGPRYVARLGS